MFLGSKRMSEFIKLGRGLRREILGGKKTRARVPIPAKTRRSLTTKAKKCKWCRKSPIQEIHHIDGNRSNKRESNLIGLCGTCHNRATRGEITKDQLWKRLGIRKQIRKATKKRRVKRKRPVSQLGVSIPSVDDLL